MTISSHPSKVLAGRTVGRWAGLYALKPWYARRLEPVVAGLEQHGVTPNQVSVAGVLFAGAAGAVAAFVPPGPMTALLIAGLLAARLACANMDGTLARRRRPDPTGGLSNELGDRAADLLTLACFVPHLGWSGFAVLLAATLPSWAALAVAAQGAERLNAGPVGKTERCVLVVLAAGTGWFVGVGFAIVIGSVMTVAARLMAGRGRLRTGAQR
jgi:CDP-diacylglycerol--glycerol-3-phosphate 3-phosphatidyltransferase